MFAVVHVLDVPAVRALVRSQHYELARAREALTALRSRQPGKPYTIVQLYEPSRVGDVISGDEIEAGIAENDVRPVGR